MQDFGKRIRALRKKQGLSQKELACLSGISPSYLSRIERGERGVPHLSALLKLVEILYTSAWELLTLAGYISDETPYPTGAVPRHWHCLIADSAIDNSLRDLGQLSEQEKSSLRLYLRAIKLQRDGEKNTVDK
jgi:transcriptional regulator with XRE-family HTH domain